MLSDNKLAADGEGMVTYQFEVEDEEWNAWKETVPRSKSLDKRLRELIRADTDGRVNERGDQQASSAPTDNVGAEHTHPPDGAEDVERRRESPSQPSQPENRRETQVSTEAAEDGALAPADELPKDIEDALREFLDDRPPRSSHGRDIVVDALKELRQNGPMKTADLQEAVYEGYEEHYGDPRNLWNSIGRYLDDIPGFTKPGYGEWGYAGDKETRVQFEDES